MNPIRPMPPARRTVLFVCYGSGHVRMVLPVALAMQALPEVQVRVLGLTTAAAEVTRAGLPLLQFKDFVQPADAGAVAHGRELMRDLAGPVADPDETAAYLGLSYRDLVTESGADEAARRYAERGRQAFLPVPTLRHIVQQVGADLVVATNSPRGERAAIVAAGQLGVPAACIVDLFAIDEVQWIGALDYAQRVCVLNAAVKGFLVQAGRRDEQIMVTGNPAFDALHDPALVRQGHALRQAQGWQRQRVILWPTQVEPAVHPFNGQPGDASLPARALDRLVALVLSREDCILCVRPRAGEALPTLPAHPRILITGQDWPLQPLLHAVDMVVTLTSTVGLEGHLVGARVLQVRGSVFDHAMPLQAYGLADEAVGLDGLDAAFHRCLALPRHAVDAQALATPRVVAVLQSLLSPLPTEPAHVEALN